MVGSMPVFSRDENAHKFECQLVMTLRLLARGQCDHQW